SHSATAGICNCAARSASCSGVDAPRKKLNALRQWSSMYCLVINSPHKAAVGRTENPEKRAIRSLNVPLLARPTPAVPPIAGTEKWPAHFHNRAGKNLVAQQRRFAFAKFDMCRQRWAKPTQLQSNAIFTSARLRFALAGGIFKFRHGHAK